MEFTIDRDAFSRALARMQGIVEKKSTMAVLSNTLIRADETGSITLAATDLDVTLVGRYPASVEKTGAITVGARALYDIVRNLPPGELALLGKENNYVEIRHGNIEYSMVGMPPDEFPALPEAGELPMVTINKRLLFSMIEGVIFSVSTDDTRPNLNGVLVKPGGGERLMMVSTDGHRLSKLVRHIGTPLEGLPEEGVIIPRKGLAELKRAMDDASEKLSFGVQSSQVIFRGESDTLFVRLIDGVFPDFNRVIPKTNKNVARIERDHLMTALRRISLFAQAKTMGIRIALATEGKVRITASNPDLGRAQEEFEVDYAGDALEIGYNAKYLLDCLTPLDTSEVRFEMNDDLSPGIIRVDGDDDSFYVVMPMRL
ncbi:MAG: DNA polymerase III subunit beta [Myxococcota bacterium]|jgi:DNA polymerase-3 subunit beta|nr:DNA polymerase III subunit beta [Myxococcota bacterium]